MSSVNDLVKPEVRAALTEGDIVESLENNVWYRAKIVKVLEPGRAVRIHYLGWKAKWDKDINLTSPSVRYRKENVVKKSAYNKGQKVMATFTDGVKYPAEILAINQSGTYQVKFYDGFVKRNVQENQIAKFSEKANREAKLIADELYGGQSGSTTSEDDTGAETPTRGKDRRRSSLLRRNQNSRSRSTTPLSDRGSTTSSRRSSISTKKEVKKETPKRKKPKVEKIEDEIEVLEVCSIEKNGEKEIKDEFEFKEEKEPKVSIKRDINGLEQLAGSSGLNQHVSVFRQKEWHEAVIVQAPTKGAKSTPSGPLSRHIFVHYKGWNKQYDEWVKLDRDTVKLSTKAIVKPVKHEFKNGAQVLAVWSDKKYYPAKVISCLAGGNYQVEFYDGFIKKLPSSQVKSGTEKERQEALKEAERVFGEKEEKKQRKSIFKRSADQDQDPEVKRIILGQKRPRPPSTPSSPKSPPPTKSPEPVVKVKETPKEPEKRPRRSLRGQPQTEPLQQLEMEKPKEKSKEKVKVEPKEKVKVENVTATPEVKRPRGRPRLNVTPKITEPPPQPPKEPVVEPKPTPNPPTPPAPTPPPVSSPPPTPQTDPTDPVDEESLLEASLESQKRAMMEQEKRLAELKAARERRERDEKRLTPDQLSLYQELKAKLTLVEADRLLATFLVSEPKSEKSPEKQPEVNKEKEEEKKAEESSPPPAKRTRKQNNSATQNGQKDGDTSRLRKKR